MHTALELMHRIFPVRSCDYPLPSEKVKLCLEYQIRRCEGPCEGLTGRDEYRRHVDQAVRFLKGDNASIVRELEARMEKAAAELRFEGAARCRDQLRALQMMQRRQKVMYDEAVDRDVIGLARSDDDACCAFSRSAKGVCSGRNTTSSAASSSIPTPGSCRRSCASSTCRPTSLRARSTSASMSRMPA